MISLNNFLTLPIQLRNVSKILCGPKSEQFSVTTLRVFSTNQNFLSFQTVRETDAFHKLYLLTAGRWFQSSWKCAIWSEEFSRSQTVILWKQLILKRSKVGISSYKPRNKTGPFNQKQNLSSVHKGYSFCSRARWVFSLVYNMDKPCHSSFVLLIGKMEC